MCRAGEPDVRLTDQKLITIPGQMPGLNASVIFHLINEVTIGIIDLYSSLLQSPHTTPDRRQCGSLDRGTCNFQTGENIAMD